MAGVLTPQDLIALLARRGTAAAVVSVRGDRLETWSGAQVADRARRLAAGLRAVGVVPGEAVGLYGANRPEWLVARLAIGALGAVAAPFDDLLPETEVAPLIRAAGCRHVFVSRAHLAELQRRFAGSPLRFHVLEAEPEELSWRRLLADTPADLPPIDPDAPAMLVSTSGTTGAPKRFTLSHANLSANVRAVERERQIGPDDRMLLPLPMDNVYPYVVGVMASLVCGATLVFPEAITGPQIVKALGLSRATAMIGVPRLYAALVSGIRMRVAGRGRLALRVFEALLWTSITIKKATGVGLGRVLFASLHKQFGPRLRLLVSGGAPLEAELIWILEGLGWEMLGGYGLSEVGSVFTGNVPGRKRIGTEGQPIHGPGSLRIAALDDTDIGADVGEIQLKGPSVFAGYIDNPEATRAAFTEDGWFRTGDLGRLDAEGYVVVTGRVKEMIVLGGGKNVFPEELERLFRASPCIEEIAVLEHAGSLVGLVVPDMAAIRDSGYTRVEEVLRVALAEAGRGLPAFQRLSGFAIQREPLPRTRLGKYRRFLLPELYRRARDGAAGPTRAKLTDTDKALLAEPLARQVWELLKARYADKPVTLDASPQLDLGIDSLEWVSLGLALDERFGLRLGEAEVAEVGSLRELLRVVLRATETRPAALGTEPSRWLEPPGPAVRAFGTVLHGVNWFLARLLFRLRVTGAVRLPVQPPCLFVANHASDLDPAVLAAALPAAHRRAVHWGGDSVRVFSGRVLRHVARALRVFPVDDRAPAASLTLAARVLAQGGDLAWFPESWRSPDGELQSFLPGVGRLVADFDGPVVPVHIAGSFAAWPRWRRLPRPHRVEVIFGAPLMAEDLRSSADGETSSDKEIADKLHRAVAALRPA